MPRPKKDAKVLNIKLASSVYVRLEEFCEETGINKTLAVERILNLYFSEYFSRPLEERLANMWKR